MRQDRPPLRALLRTSDARLRSPEAVRTIATVTVVLLALQGAVVADRAEVGSGPVADVSSAGAERAVPADAIDPAAPRSTATRAAAPAASPAQPPAPTAGATPAEDTRAHLHTAASADGAATSDGTSAPGGDAAARPTGHDDAGSSAMTRSVAAPSAASAAPADPARARFEERFPAHARARQNVRDPRTTRWAVLIGVNEHSGRTRDNVGSRQDAEDLYRHLTSLGWAEDRIVLLTDHAATRENIVQALRWLQRKTDRDSVAVVHYSGHTKQWHGRDVDGDGEVTDEALWPTDNRFITDREVGELLGRVRAGRLWFNVGACEAAGFDDWGITGPDRIATYSSGEHQKSYEDPSRGNSVWGYHLIEEGFIAGHADANGDGNVTVEEAFRFATPRAHQRTRGQAKGRQTPETSDRFPGEFDLRIPPPPPPPSRSEPSQQEERRCLLCPPTSTTSRLRVR